MTQNAQTEKTLPELLWIPQQRAKQICDRLLIDKMENSNIFVLMTKIKDDSSLNENEKMLLYYLMGCYHADEEGSVYRAIHYLQLKKEANEEIPEHLKDLEKLAVIANNLSIIADALSENKSEAKTEDSESNQEKPHTDFTKQEAEVSQETSEPTQSQEEQNS